MNKKNTSFNMRNEFNGYAQKTYLKGNQRRAYEALSQQNVRVSTDVNSFVSMAQGAIPVYIDANLATADNLLAVGAIPQIMRIQVNRDARTGVTNQTFRMAGYGATTGAYLQAQTSNPVVVVIPNPIKGSWILEANKKWRYYLSDNYLINQWIYHSDLNWYYVDKDGYMVAEWLKYKNSWYYLRTKLKNGIEDRGQMVVGWIEVNEKWYYFKSNVENGIERGGQMVLGWRQIQYKGSMKWFYFKPEEESGYMVLGWRRIQYKGLLQWFYFKENGVMAQSEEVTDPKTGKKYRANENGVCTAASEGAGDKYVTTEQLKQLGWSNITDEMVKGLNNALVKYNITTPERIRHFISQAMHESGLGIYTKETASGNAYEGRTDLGNTQTGDGPKYKGVGYIQMTGRANYQAFADYMGDQDIMKGVDYVSGKYPWEAAGFWWYDNGMNAIVDSLAGTSIDQQTLEISRTVNRGNRYSNGMPNHYEERRDYYILTLDIIK